MAAALLLAAFALADGPTPAAVSLEIRDPAALLAHPRLVNVWAELRDDPVLRDGFARPEWDAVLNPLRFVAARSGRDVPTLLADLTAGGVRFEWNGIEGGPAALTVTASSPQVWTDLIPALRRWLTEVTDPLTALIVLPPNLKDGQEWAVGTLRYRIDGAVLRLAAEGAAFAPAAAAVERVHLRLGLNALRTSGRLPRSSGSPWEETAPAALFGGYLDAFGESETLLVTLADSQADSC